MSHATANNPQAFAEAIMAVVREEMETLCSELRPEIEGSSRVFSRLDFQPDAASGQERRHLISPRFGYAYRPSFRSCALFRGYSFEETRDPSHCVQQS